MKRARTATHVSSAGARLTWSAIRRRTVTVLLASVCAVAGPTVMPDATAAGPPGRWTSVTGSSADIGIIARPSTVRTADGVLHVVYVRRDGLGSYSLRHVAVSANGVAGSASTIVSGWAVLTRDPEIVLTPSGLRVVFSGLRNDLTFDPYTNGAAYYATSDTTGSTWTLQTTYLTESTTAYASYGTGAVTMSDGSTFLAYPLNSTIRYADTVVADPTTPTEDPQFSFSPGTSVYDVEVARVPGTDEVWMSWFALSSSTPAERGVFVRRITPTLGPVLRAPQSVTTVGGTTYATQFSGPPPLVARTGGAVSVAYPVGYPSARRIAVWRVGTTAPQYLPDSADGRYVDLSVDAGDRIWAAWASGHTVRAARSNPQGTRFGAPVTLGSVRVAGNPSTWDVQVDAAGGPADVLVNTSTQLVHQRVLAGLTLAAAPRSWDGDRAKRVVFTVTDAGTAVRGAVVRAGRLRCTTSRAGTCRIRFGRSDARRLTARATRSGYAAAAVRLRVKR